MIAAGVLLYKNWDKIKAVAESVGKKIKEIWTSVKTSLSNTLKSIKDTFSNTWENIKQKASSVWDWIKTKATNVWNGIKSAIVTPFQNAKDSVANLVESIREKVSSAWERVSSIVSNFGSSIWNALTWPFREAWDTISDAIGWIKDLFPIDLGRIFERIKLPHLSVEWTELTALGRTIKFPSGFDVDWYKNGGIFDSPSIIGVGEAGSEAVVPLDKFWNKLDNLAAAQTAPVINIYPTPNQNAREIAREVEKILVQYQKQKVQAYGI